MIEGNITRKSRLLSTGPEAREKRPVLRESLEPKFEVTKLALLSRSRRSKGTFRHEVQQRIEKKAKVDSTRV